MGKISDKARYGENKIAGIIEKKYQSKGFDIVEMSRVVNSGAMGAKRASDAFKGDVFASRTPNYEHKMWLEKLYIEHKERERISIPSWWTELLEKMKKDRCSNDIPLLTYKLTKSNKRHNLVTMRLEDLLDIITQLDCFEAEVQDN